jgi:predicted DNA binding CopG/RHH family protein
MRLLADHGIKPSQPLPTTTIRLDPEDIAKARQQAADRGLRYQTYLKMMIHEALRNSES